MKRRDFLKKGTMVAGLASSPTLVLPAIAEETAKQKPSEGSRPAGAASEENSFLPYLRRARADESSPKSAGSSRVAWAGWRQISPMPLEERLRRGIVPRRGFCSIAPAADVIGCLKSRLTIAGENFKVPTFDQKLDISIDVTEMTYA